MALLPFRMKQSEPQVPSNGAVQALLRGYSIEVMPRTADKIADFRALLPAGTRVYIAHIQGTTIEEMTTTARRLAEAGMDVMPHFPARIIRDAAMLGDWIARYQGEAGVDQGLILAGNPTSQAGDFDSSMQLLETGLFERAGFKRLHVAGHPEGSRDIDPDGSDK
ncbi:MAG: methylenetetrahydrofolate reductase, partial [Marinosulfonomonas sp.]|nr:methylenetetrahydrofolate reductase [Marinosulfonomonas sp.]